MACARAGSSMTGSSDAPPLLEADNLHYSWPDGGQQFDGVTFGLHAGERAVLIGANGSGKSTLLKLLNGLLEPSAGHIRFEGRAVNVKALKQPGFRAQFRRRVGLVFQHPEAMLFNPTVLEEIAYGPDRLGMDQPNERARGWAACMGLENALDAPPYRLSGGEKQRLALACVLACEPDVLLLDEPTANLDPRATAFLIEYLADQTDRTILTSTQNLALAETLGNRALILSPNGCLGYDGDLAEAIADRALLSRAGLVPG